MQSLHLSSNPMITISIVSGLANDYSLNSDVIGSNTCEKIYKASPKSDSTKEVIIKVSTFSQQVSTSRISNNPLALLINELAIIETLKKNPHSNIARYDFAGIDVETKELYEIMEYNNDETIYHHNNFTLDQALDICYQIASGLDHLHMLGITHSDVKSGNIHIHKDQTGQRTFKLAGFRPTCMKNNLKIMPDDVFFKAPELFDVELGLSNKIDIWGLGVIFYHLVFKKFPFDDKNGNSTLIIEKIKDNFLHSKNKAQSLKIFTKVKQLVEGMLEKNPEKRFSAKNVVLIIEEIKNLELRPYISLGTPINLSDIQMQGTVCSCGRGIVKLSNQIYCAIDHYGNVQQINATNKKLIRQQQFDVGCSFGWWNSIITNKAKNCLLVSGYGNSIIYAVDPISLQKIRVWKQTHEKYLFTIIFLDNTVFCAGYSDGLLKKYNENSCNELASFKISEKYVHSFCADSNSRELLVGDGGGALYSINWELFTATNWSIQLNQGCITCISKSRLLIAIGSDDKSITLLNSLNPPQVINRIQTNSLVHQLQLTADCANLLALCRYEFILFKNIAGQFQKLYLKSKNPDFKDQDLQSFILFDDDNAIVGDLGGRLFSMALLK